MLSAAAARANCSPGNLFGGPDKTELDRQIRRAQYKGGSQAFDRPYHGASIVRHSKSPDSQPGDVVRTVRFTFKRAGHADLAINSAVAVWPVAVVAASPDAA